jgi:hypothetical protein
MRGAKEAGPDLEGPSGEGSCRDGLVSAMAERARGEGESKGNKNKKEEVRKKPEV